LLYRIYTENKPGAEAVVIDLLKQYGLPNATLYKGIGIWEGNKEANLTIEIDAEGEVGYYLSEFNIRLFAEAIRQALNQEAVMVVKIEAESFIVR
jgi:hypothetical protein